MSTNPAPPFKIKTGDTGAQAIFDAAASVSDAIAAEARQIGFGPWREYAQAVGVSGPQNVNRAQQAIRAIKGSGR
jgi:hypothetical protein